MEPTSFICGWASLPETRQPASSDSHLQVPFLLVMAASHTPAQARSARRMLLYLYCLIVYIHLIHHR